MLCMQVVPFQYVGHMCLPLARLLTMLKTVSQPAPSRKDANSARVTAKCSENSSGEGLFPGESLRFLAKYETTCLHVSSKTLQCSSCSCVSGMIGGGLLNHGMQSSLPIVLALIYVGSIDIGRIL